MIRCKSQLILLLIITGCFRYADLDLKNFSVLTFSKEAWQACQKRLNNFRMGLAIVFIVFLSYFFQAQCDIFISV